MTKVLPCSAHAAARLRLYRGVPEAGPQRSREELDCDSAEHGLCHIKSTCEGEKRFRALS